MRSRIVALAVLLVALAVATRAHAAEWDSIRPGESTQAAVRAQLGEPTKMSSQKVEGYDTVQWIYEGERAPKGMVRAIIDFGLLTPQGYRPDVVRVMNLTPRGGVFPRRTVMMGWGRPEKVGKDKDAEVFFYESGLLVYFDKEGRFARTMIFTPPQRPAAGGAPPKR